MKFSLSGNFDSGETTKDLKVVIQQGNSASEYYFSFYWFPGWSRTNMGWVEKELTFAATGSSVRINFISQESNAYGPALDNVRAFVVPLPGTVVLFSLGLAGLLLARRGKVK